MQKKDKRDNSEVIEEKRVTKTVIRRRRKRLETESLNQELGDRKEEQKLVSVEKPEKGRFSVSKADEKNIFNEKLDKKSLEVDNELDEIKKDKDQLLSKVNSPKKVFIEDSEKKMKRKDNGESLVSKGRKGTFLAKKDSKVKVEEKSNLSFSNEKNGQKSKTKYRKRKVYENKPAKIISKPVVVSKSTSSDVLPKESESKSKIGKDLGLPLDKLKQGETFHRRKRTKKNLSSSETISFGVKNKTKKKNLANKDGLHVFNKNAKRRRNIGRKNKEKKKLVFNETKAIKRRVKVAEVISVSELAKRMGIKAAKMIGKLMKQNMMLTLNQSLDIDEAVLVAQEFGFEIEKVGFEEHDLLERKEDRLEDLKIRPPVVTIMGHVDHGKTSLLDAIRRSNVVIKEVGGITQHIGAYNVKLEEGVITFVDTPGHEAFTQMRSRGAQVTDIVVLVVAADDGIMDQTKEAINHSKAAGVPIVIAVNKIDKPGADPERVFRELSELGLVPESWGGESIVVKVSAKTGDGVSDLLEMLLLQSEILELSANPNKMARGRVLEARLDKGRGPFVTMLVQEGTLKNGDAFVCGIYSGKVRALFDERKCSINEAGPSVPVGVQGIGGVPEAGDEFIVVKNDRIARQIAGHRASKKRETELTKIKGVSLENFFEHVKSEKIKELKLVVKADVQGSAQAVVEVLEKIGNEEAKITVLHAATGAVTETDVMLAAASEAIVIGFNVRPTGKAMEIAEAENVDIRTYEIIYRMLDDITAALTGLLSPLKREEIVGKLEVRDIFNVPKLGTIAGSYVIFGKVNRNDNARLLRSGRIIVDTKILSLRRFKEDVKEVLQGFECGIGLFNYNDIKRGDEIEVYVVKEEQASL